MYKGRLCIRVLDTQSSTIRNKTCKNQNNCVSAFLVLYISRVTAQFDKHGEKNNRKGQSALGMAVVQTIMDSKKKSGPSERPNMQSANVFKGFTNRASGSANVYWAWGKVIGQPHVWMCQPGNTPLPKMSLCAAMATAGVLAEADVIVNVLLRRREAIGVMERTAETFLSHRKWNKLCTHCGWPNTDELIHTLTYIHTLSQKSGLLSNCFPKSASKFFFLSFICPHISAIYFCLYSVSSSIITGTTGD